MLRLVDRIVEVTAVLAFAVSSLLIFLNVLNRYLVLGVMRNYAKEYESFRSTYTAIRSAVGNVVITADEIPGYLLVWVAFLGAYLAMRREGHISFEMLSDALPQLGRQILSGLNTCLISGFLVLIFFQSVRMIRVSGATEIETAEISQGWFMLIMPLGAAFLLVAVVARFVNSLRYQDRVD